MQCWRPCRLPPAQPSAALGSSASLPSMRSTITKLIELSLFSQVAGTKPCLLCTSSPPSCACFLTLLLTLLFKPHTPDPEKHTDVLMRFYFFSLLSMTWCWGQWVSLHTCMKCDTLIYHHYCYQPQQTIMSQRKLSPRLHSDSNRRLSLSWNVKLPSSGDLEHNLKQTLCLCKSYQTYSRYISSCMFVFLHKSSCKWQVWLMSSSSVSVAL